MIIYIIIGVIVFFAIIAVIIIFNKSKEGGDSTDGTNLNKDVTEYNDTKIPSKNYENYEKSINNTISQISQNQQNKSFESANIVSSYKNTSENSFQEMIAEQSQTLSNCTGNCFSTDCWDQSSNFVTL